MLVIVSLKNEVLVCVKDSNVFNFCEAKGASASFDIDRNVIKHHDEEVCIKTSNPYLSLY